MVEYRALGVGSARRSLARVNALVAQASLVRVAVFIGTAAEGTHVMQADVAQETIVVQPAGQQAVAADTLLIQRAIIVHRADRQANVLATGVAAVAVLASQAGYWHCGTKERFSSKRYEEIIIDAEC